MDAVMPLNGPVLLGSVQLPAGTQLLDWNDVPALWATSTPVPDAGRVWLDLHEMHEQPGRAPNLLGFLDDRGGQDRPWDSGELGDRASLSDVDELDAAEVISESWDGSIDPDDDDPEQLEQFAPFTMRFPGLALRQTEEFSRPELTAALSSFRSARIGLVPARRAADILALVGYNGTVNRYGDPGDMTAVLRSWEERFGTVLVEVGFDHFRLLVKRPPRTRPAAEAAAAEIWAMCDEFWKPGIRPYALTTVREIADHILGAPFWALWLD